MALATFIGWVGGAGAADNSSGKIYTENYRLKKKTVVRRTVFWVFLSILSS